MCRTRRSVNPARTTVLHAHTTFVHLPFGLRQYADGCLMNSDASARYVSTGRLGVEPKGGTSTPAATTTMSRPLIVEKESTEQCVAFALYTGLSRLIEQPRVFADLSRYQLSRFGIHSAGPGTELSSSTRQAYRSISKSRASRRKLQYLVHGEQ